VGRPVERRLEELMLKADSGDSGARVAAILELSRYSGFPLQGSFAHWLLDADDRVSRAAALALVTARPRTSVSAFTAGLQSGNADARANAAWALGMLGAPASALLPLLRDQDPHVLQLALLALARAPGDVSAGALLPLLSNDDAAVRGAAAVALARHQPEAAIKAIPAQLQKETVFEQAIHDEHARPGTSKLTRPQIDSIMKSFKCQMEMMRALHMLQGSDATRELEELAFRPDKGLPSYDAIVAGFQLWDRIGADAAPAVEALGSADRAEWILVKAGPAVLTEVRQALDSENSAVRQRAMSIVAWQGDTESLTALQAIQKTDAANAVLATWAIEKIQTLHPNGR
jgi:glycerophosphoryl diester phosphodiesterase